MLQTLQQTPVASYIFAITLLTSLYAFYGNHSLIRSFSLYPYSISRGKKLYTIITSGLVHANWAHLAFNLLSYYFFAFTLERIAGHWQFFIIYFSGLALSDLTTIIKNKNNTGYYSLGASGAISALLFSYILFDPFSRIMIFPIPFPIPAFVFAGLYLLYCMYASRRQSDNINHEAHFWGAITGVVATSVLYPGVFLNFVAKIL